MKTTSVIDYHTRALNLLRHSKQVTRNDLAVNMGVSLSMANRVVNDLIEAGIIYEKGQLESSGGRPANLLALNSKAAYTIGVDYGEKHQMAVVADLSGKEICRLVEQALPTEKQEEVIESILDLVRRATKAAAAEAAAVPSNRILGLGIGIRDIVDSRTGVVYGNSGQPGWGSVWVDFPLYEQLRTKVSYPHIIVDDIVRAMGTAEAVYSSRLRRNNFLYILADEGIGMAIMINGKPFTGFSHIAGEIGHIPVENGPMCMCGNQGCLCLYASAPSIEQKVRDRLNGKPQQSVLRALEEVEIGHIIQAAKEGDKLAYQALTEAGEYLGKALAIVVNLLGPRHIIIGGKLAEAEIYLQAAYHMIKITALDKASRHIQMHHSSLDELAGPLGAATLALNALFEPGERNLLFQVRNILNEEPTQKVDRMVSPETTNIQQDVSPG